MTIISSILQDAYRESNIIPIGRALKDPEVAEALRLLNNLFYSLCGTEMGENFQDFPLGSFGRQQVERLDPPFASYFNNPPINRRLLALNEAPLTVYFPASPNDGSRMAVRDPFGRLAAFPITLDGNGRPIAGSSSVVLSTNGADFVWVYRADLGEWVVITPKIATEEMPFPREFDEMFTILLAMRINPRHGRELDQQSALILKRGQQAFVNRYLQSAPLQINDDISWPFMSIQGYENGGVAYNSTAAFNRGDWRP